MVSVPVEMSEEDRRRCSEQAKREGKTLDARPVWVGRQHSVPQTGEYKPFKTPEGHGAEVPLLSQGQAPAAAPLEGIAWDGPAPTEDQLSRLATISWLGPRQVKTPRQGQLKPWSDRSYQWIAKNRLQMTRIHELLAMRGC